MRFQTASVTHVGKVRRRNEDSVLARPDLGLWAVADGMGGHDAGDVASRTVVAALDGVGAPASAADLLRQSEERLFAANREIVALSRARGGATIGTTVVVLLIRDAHYACVWAGDSRIYLLRDGVLTQLTRDHTEIEELIASGARSREEVKDWPNNVITRAVGVGDDPSLEVVSGPVEHGDTFLLCSDGLTKHLDDDDIARHLGAGGDVQASCESMLAMALDRGGLDNVTIVVVRPVPLARTSEPTLPPSAVAGRGTA